MDRSVHTMSCLFAQLGKTNNAKDIEAFIKSHKGLPASTPLHQANFWNESQARFLKEAIYEDSDWAEIVDSLDTQLR
ncbi:DUF2789 domain-containing protein [Thalassotalea piscium]|uniref:DUF2789 domain-containing protein n=1 Tax=Thalassotalea piscium TaxID=1230533 RepID=A0A7X0NIE1_9GAMM|nr:DUF2789 domain-containing protein [Thalassotalea piscium]MBB6543985.1 hypothetical protein [Thalassotalea piscium]